MNIGKWIVIAFILFAGFIGTLVTICIRQDVNLVSKEYYEEELAYQDQIKRISNTQALADRPSISKANETTLEIEFRQSIDRGEVRIFCPSDPQMDRNIELRLLQQNTQFVDISALRKGMYRVRLLWEAKGVEYFLEEVIYI